ncbi:unnamed protein product, partial [Linum tenue]
NLVKFHTREPTLAKTLSLQESKISGKDQDSSGISLAVAAVAGVAAAAYGIASLFSGSESTSTNGKTMKAPGRDARILRDDFERNPSGYFRDLRNK